ncbi:MAG: hypothetical protein KZQ99_22585, partial [Candidatus Thiodiazotropha sp. (ex Dulcina madagascariensis)]|nr:hypothetical protein [Candidatus Thiodiazotropha sp. (ex Dulcina madagascariensis)]
WRLPRESTLGKRHALIKGLLEALNTTYLVAGLIAGRQSQIERPQTQRYLPHRQRTPNNSKFNIQNS